MEAGPLFLGQPPIALEAGRRRLPTLTVDRNVTGGMVGSGSYLALGPRPCTPVWPDFAAGPIAPL